MANRIDADALLDEVRQVVSMIAKMPRSQLDELTNNQSSRAWQLNDELSMLFLDGDCF